MATAKVHISGFKGADPTIDMEVLKKTSVNVYVGIAEKTLGGGAATDPGRVAQVLADVNALYAQVAIKFVLKGAILPCKNDDFLAPNDAAQHSLCTRVPHSSPGIELYFVDSILGSAGVHWPGEGIIVGDLASSEVVAHEIGHACNLRDIYETKLPAMGPLLTVTGPVSKTREPRDWNSGPGPRYYNVKLDQENLIHRLMMYGYADLSGVHTGNDIPRGSIYGVWSAGPGYLHGMGQAPVGLQHMNRNPHTR